MPHPEDNESAERVELYVVSALRTVAGDSAFTSWLGYPKSRNCWRSISTHFPAAGVPRATACTHARLSVSIAEGDPVHTILDGRMPPAKDIRTAPSTKQSTASSQADRNPALANKKRKREYETKVHTIRIDQAGVHEFCGIRRSDGSLTADVPLAATTTAVQADTASTVDAPSTSSTAPACTDDIATLSEISNGSSVITIGSGGTSGNGSVSISGSGQAAAGRNGAYERSQLWAAHRQLNEAVWRSSIGSIFRIDVGDVTDSQVTINWVYPGSSPGDASAWIGLWDANAFDWTTGESRPRYIRYKAITSSRQQGSMRFTAKEWAGLPDGEYLFSIDTGALSIGAADSNSYCVSQRLKIVNEAVAGLIGRPHGSPLPPTANQVALSRTSRIGGCSTDKHAAVSGSESDSDETEQQYLFPVPLLEYEASETTQEVKTVYSLIERLSYLDWGLRSEDEVSGKRASRNASHASDDFGGCIVHDGTIWGEAAHGRGNKAGPGAKTARTSEGYGEATCATAERLVRVLQRLTDYVPSMAGWEGLWNLDADATFLDIGSGYGKVRAPVAGSTEAWPSEVSPKSLDACDLRPTAPLAPARYAQVVVHAKLHTGCRSAVGVECVAKRVEISNTALQGLYCELDRERLADDLLKGVAFEAVDATTMPEFAFSHVYIFDRVFSDHTLVALGKVLQRSPFHIMISARPPRVWWGVGLSKIQPVAKMRFKTTGKEGMTAFVYINSHFIPGVVPL